jgi:hypothetical protein
MCAYVYEHVRMYKTHMTCRIKHVRCVYVTDIYRAHMYVCTHVVCVQYVHSMRCSRHKYMHSYLYVYDLQIYILKVHSHKNYILHI